MKNFYTFLLIACCLFTGSKIYAQTCDTLRNWSPSDGLTQLSATPASNGFIWGHNLVNAGTEQVLAWGERYTAPSSVEVRRITFIPWKVVNGGGTVTFNIQADNAGLPGTVQASETVILSDLTENSLEILDFAAPATVSGNFWVTMNMNYANPNDSLALLGTYQPGAGVNTTYLSTAGWGWEPVEDWYTSTLNSKIRWRVDVLTSNGPAPTADVSFDQTSVCLGTAFNADAGTSTNATYYEWYLTDHPITTIFENTTGVTTTLTPAQTGQHRVYIFADGSCKTDAGYYVVNVNPAVSAIVTKTDATCGDNNGQILISNASGGNGTYTYSIDGVNYGSSAAYSNLQPDNYTVYVRTAGGGCEETYSITINALPQESITVGASNSICAGDNTSLTASGNGTIEWFNGATSIGTGTSLGVTPAVTTTYTAVLTDGNGCTDTDQITITVNPVDDASFSYSSSSFCIGSGNVTPTINTTGTFTADSPDLIFADTGTGEINLSTSQAGNYQITFTTSGTCPNTESVSVTINSTPDASFSYASSTLCSGAADVSPTSVTTTGGTFSSAPAGLTVNSVTGEIILSTSTEGAYTVTYDFAGDCPASASQNITITSAPDASFGYASTAYCTNEGNPSPVYTTGSAGTFSSTSGLSINASTGVINLAASTPGIYTVTNSISASGCPLSSETFVVTINEIPTVNAGVSQSICDGESVTLAASGNAVSYTWDHGVADGVAFTPAVGSETYTVTGTSAGNCTNTATVSVTVNTLPAATITGGGTVCAGDTEPQVTFTGINGSSYIFTYSVNAGPQQTVTTSGSDTVITISVPTSTPVIYVYELINVEDITTGCDQNQTGTAIVVVNGLPAVNAGPDLTACEGDLITLSGSGATNYTWDNGVVDGAAFAPSLGTTTYTVTGTDGNGCVNTDQVAVTVNALPTVTLSGLETIPAVCVDHNPFTLTQGAPAGGTYSGTGVSGGTFDPSAAGVGTHTIVYTVTENGCEGSAQATVTVDACLGIETEYMEYLSVFPNPAASALNVVFENTSANDAKIALVSTDGKIVYNTIAKAMSVFNKQIDVTNIEPGVYFIVINSESASIMQKVILN